MENKKGLALRILLYIVPYLFFFISVYLFTINNLLWFFIILAISLGIYLFLIIKNYKVISPLSSITFVILIFFIFAMTVSGKGGLTANPLNERTYMLGVAFALFFNLLVGVVWYLKEQIWKKVFAIIHLVITNILLISYSSIPVNFYSNFIYTRIFIALVFLFGILLIVKGKAVFRILGIIVMFLSIGSLLFSASLLSDRIFTLVDQERQEVFDFVDPKAAEMIKYYNRGELSQDKFCKYCGFTLISTLYSNPKNFAAIRLQYGEIISVEDPIIYRAMGQFYVVYPGKFENVKDKQYVIFSAESIKPDSKIFGFAISPKIGIP